MLGENGQSAPISITNELRAGRRLGSRLILGRERLTRQRIWRRYVPAPENQRRAFLDTSMRFVLLIFVLCVVLGQVGCKRKTSNQANAGKSVSADKGLGAAADPAQARVLLEQGKWLFYLWTKALSTGLPDHLR